MITKSFNKWILLILFMAIRFISIAQEGAGEIDIVDTEKSTSNTWYNQPWFWILGTLGFILFLLLLLKNTRVPKDQKRI